MLYHITYFCIYTIHLVAVIWNFCQHMWCISWVKAEFCNNVYLSLYMIVICHAISYYMSIIWSSFSYFKKHLSYCMICITCIRCKVSHFYNISHNVVKTSHVYSKNITYISKYICMHNCLSI